MGKFNIIKAQIPPDELQRLKALLRYEILDTDSEESFDDLALLASQICDTPSASISLVDENRQWFKSKIGMADPETPRDLSFCAHGILQREIFEVQDTQADERFSDNPLVTGDADVRFYAGAPLVTPDGFALGMLCVNDHVPRKLSTSQKAGLSALSRQVIAQLELRSALEKKKQNEVQSNTMLEALSASELRYRRLFEAAQDGVLILDYETGNIDDVNPYLCQLLGFSRDEMLGQTVGEISPFKDLDLNTAMSQRLKLDGVVRYDDLPLESKDGSKISVEFVSNVYKVGDKKVIQCNIRDITKRKASEMALLRLGAIVEFSDDAIIGKDLNSTITSWNKGAEHIFGYTAEEMIGASIMSLIPSDRQDEEKKILNEINSGKSIQHFETLRQTKDGILIDVSVTASPIKDGCGNPVGVSKILRDITSRKRTEKALREEQHFITAVVDTVGSLVVVIDRKARIIRFNRACEELTGYASKEILGKNLIDLLIMPEERASTTHEFNKLCSGQFPNTYENHWVTKDGKKRVIAWANTALLDAAGAVAFVIGTGTDITVRKRASEALVESESKFRLLAENITDVFWISQPDFSKIDYVSRAYGSIWGYSTESLYADPHQWVRTILPEDRDRVLASFGSLMKDRASVSVEYRIVRPDGAIRWVHDRGFQVKDSSNRLVRLTGIAADITERKRTEVQIAEQASYLDKARDAIVALDLDNVVLFWNQGAERLYGWTSKEVVGRDVSKFFYRQYQAFEQVKALLLETEEWSGELVQLTRDQREITVESRRTLIRNDAGQPESVLVINSDITEKKKIEAQFMRAQRMESIGTLASGIAHDLNNILAPIMMSIDLLMDESDATQKKEILETIKLSATRGADIVRQVLSFARGVEGERVEVQPKHLLRDLEKIIKDTFPKDIKLKFHIPGDIWTILGDPTQVHQILLNLCINARDAMPDGGFLNVSVENSVVDAQFAAMNLQSKPGKYVQIIVTDSGTGIEPQLIDKIFEPFFTTKGLTKGTGLGLSTVSAIVKSHDGFINVYSEPGRGTSFKIFLPALEFASEIRKGLRPAFELPRGNNELILVVDDEASILTITCQTLLAFGYRTTKASDGVEALAIYAEHKKEIAAVLTDMMMPVLDGPALIRALMKMNPDIKIIAASGLNPDGTATKLADAGVKQFLIKPYTARTLLTALQEILQEDRSYGASSLFDVPDSNHLPKAF